MIHYDLQCAEGHRFDGWFADSAGFDRQAASGLVACPECGTSSVSRALMAPAVPKRRAQRTAAAPATPPPPPGPQAGPQVLPQAVAGAEMPAKLRSLLQRMRAEVERNCDYVGPRFAAEARRIHQGESNRRGIYGETTPEEAEALAEDGIEVASIPWVPRAEG